jgi:hypothetical protein
MKLKKEVALSDTGFLLNPNTGESYSLNPLGVEILKLLNDGKDVQELPGLLSQVYDVTQSTLEKDIQDFIGIMQQFNLIETPEKE